LDGTDAVYVKMCQCFQELIIRMPRTGGAFYFGFKMVRHITDDGLMESTR